jgi:anthranilate phosphoribosyltransferase
VYDRTWVPRLAEVLHRLGAERAWVVHSEDGLDELSIFAPTWVARLEDGTVVEDVIDPRALGLGHGPEARGAVLGGSAADNATILEGVLSATPGPAHDMVVLNAAAALTVAGASPSLEAGVERARDLIDQGHALAKLKQFVAFTRRT